MTPKTFEVTNTMKRVSTTKQHMDKVDLADEIPVSDILQIIDSDDTDTETKPLVEKKRRHDVVHSPIVDYAMSTGASGVRYVMDTLSGVLNT